MPTTVSPSTGTPSDGFVLTTTVPNGRIELMLHPAYTLASGATVPVTVVATRGSIVGPIATKILASGINEGGAPAELVVRDLTTDAVTATPGAPQTTRVSWDGRDAQGRLVPADAYSLRLDFRVDDDGAVRSATATATLQMNAP